MGSRTRKQVPGPDETFDRPSQAGVETSSIFRMFKNGVTSSLFYFLKPICMDISVTMKRIPLLIVVADGPRFTDIGLELQGYVIFLRPPGFEFRSASLQGWSVLPLRNHLPFCPRWLRPKAGSSAIILRVTVRLRCRGSRLTYSLDAGKKKHVFEQMNAWTRCS